MADKLLRVRMDKIAAVLHPETGTHVTPDPTAAYPEDDVLVREYPWMFATDEELATEDRSRPESVHIETATRAPGERRGARRPK